MPYVIPVASGYHVIDDEKRYALAIAYTEQEREYLSLKIEGLKARYSAELYGLELVCEEGREIHDGISQMTLYYAHPNTYRYMPEDSPDAARYKKLREELEAIR
jgi:hypothetical protein